MEPVCWVNPPFDVTVTTKYKLLVRELGPIYMGQFRAVVSSVWGWRSALMLISWVPVEGSVLEPNHDSPYATPIYFGSITFTVIVPVP